MCSNDNPTTVPSGVVAPSVSTAAGIAPFGRQLTLTGHDVSATTFGQAAMSQVALDYQRLHFYDYACAAGRIRYAHSLAPTLPYGVSPYVSNQAAAFAGFYGHHSFGKFVPPTRFMHEEPKPQHSYIGLIGMAILSNQDKKMVLSDIYQYILDNYPYFRNRGPGWRNSIRHNLSLNDCFIKSGRSANGKGHYWAVHPANVEDFQKGDFRRRKAQRKVRRHMGLAVPDDEDSPSPPPPPPVQPCSLPGPMWAPPKPGHQLAAMVPVTLSTSREMRVTPLSPSYHKRRQFDVESLLAPDKNDHDLSSPEVSDSSQANSPVEISELDEEAQKKNATMSEEEPMDLEKKSKNVNVDPDNNEEYLHREAFHASASSAIDLQNHNVWHNAINWPPRLVNNVRTTNFGSTAVAVAAMAAAMQNNGGQVNNQVFWGPLNGLQRHTSILNNHPSANSHHVPVVNPLFVNPGIGPHQGLVIANDHLERTTSDQNTDSS